MFIDTKPTAAASAQPLPARDAAGQSLTPSYLLDLFWRRRRWIATAVVACVIAAGLFGQLAPARYTVTTQVLVDPNDLRVVDNVLRGQNQFSDTHIAQVENQVRVLVSNNVLRRVVDRLKLDQDPEFVGSGTSFLDIGGAIRALFGSQPEGRDDPALKALRVLKDRIRSKRIERTYVADTAIWAYDPHKAVKIANAQLDAFLEEQSTSRADTARRASSSLDARLVELRDRVREAEERVEDYKKSHNLLSSNGSLVNERQLTELNSQLVLVRTRTAEARARYDKIRELLRGNTDHGATGEAIGSATIVALRQQLSEILRREGEVNATLGARHPAVIEIASQARRVRALIDEEIKRIADAARNDMERAIANEANLAAQLESLKSGLEVSNDASVKLRELDRNLSVSRSVYEAFLMRMREVSEQERLDTTSVRVIAAAEVPESRSFPPRTLILLVAGAFLGAMLGAGLAVLAEWRSRSLPKPQAKPVARPNDYAPPLPSYAPPAPSYPPPPPARAPPPPPPSDAPPLSDAPPPATRPVMPKPVAVAPAPRPAPAPHVVPPSPNPAPAHGAPALHAVEQPRLRPKKLAFRL